jgi:hypothetical protein
MVARAPNINRSRKYEDIVQRLAGQVMPGSDRRLLASAFCTVAQHPSLSTLARYPQDEPANLLVKNLDPLASGGCQGLDEVIGQGGIRHRFQASLERHRRSDRLSWRGTFGAHMGHRKPKLPGCV